MSLTTTPVIPLDKDEYWADPYPILAELRDQHRTAVTPDGMKAILRWSDAEEIKKRPEFENEGLEYIEKRGFKPGDPLYEWRRHSIGALNGADHRRIRSLASRAMTPRSVEKVRPVTREHMRSLLERHSETGEFDVRKEITAIPFMTVVSFLDIEMDEAATIGQQMAGAGAEAFGPNVTQEIRDRANATFAALMEFVGGLVESRRSNPRDDLLTRLIAAEEDGDRLSHDELIVLFTNIFGGAIETTASMMTSTFLEFARRPDQLELLRRDPEGLKRSAVEEILRFRPAFYASGNKANADAEAAGLHFEAGEPLSIIIGGPNRDPFRFSDPDRFDITRDPTNWSFTFSMGPHFCLGQALARAELQETAATIARHTRDLELTAEPHWLPRVMVNHVDRCPIRYRFEP
ncbi:MAG: cytochrome P450 [bacterium]|nr:cytochrome P450 [bacterium]